MEREAKYDALVAAVTRAINDADPMGLLELGAPADEYEQEVHTIIPRLGTAADASGVARILHEEFVRWSDERIAGPEDAYVEPARRIWEAVVEFRRPADLHTRGVDE